MEDSISLVDASLEDRQAAALQLLDRYVPSDSGSKEFAAIVQGRAQQAEQAHQFLSTCGFLPNFMWWRLGCRDFRYMNWDDKSTVIDEYLIGKNISNIYYGGQHAGLFVPYSQDRTYQTGDTVYIDSDDMKHAHVFVYLGESFNDANELCWRTAEAGQTNGAGRQCCRIKKRTVKHGRVEDGRKVMGIFPLGNVVLTEDADLSPA